MARKSRYNGPVRDIFSDAVRCTAAIYLRLSVDDGDNVESNSIGNQRKICLAFLEAEPELKLGQIYVDDGHSGMNFKRPGFQAMLSDLKSKKVNCVIVKDVSRLGRHYIMTSEYVERIFPEMEVRLICINDDYDSANPQSDRESLLMPFKLMMNDTYVKDTARRIRSSIHAKMSSGSYLPASGSVPYGYLRSPESGTYKVDLETAPIVQHIFALRAQGMAFNSIAKQLNADGIPSPGKIRYDRGLTHAEKYRNALWIRGTIRKITGDAVYLGSRTHGKMGRDRLGGNKKQRPAEAWQIIPGAHAAIISQEVFDQVQEVNRIERERRGSLQKRGDPALDYREIFRGKVFCGNCGARMTAAKHEARETTPISVFFNCNQYKYSNHQRCSNHYIRQEVLMEKLEHFLENQVKIAVDVERLAAEVYARANAPGGAANRLASLHSQVLNAEAKLERLLEDAAMGILDREEYKQIKGHYLEERARLVQQEQEAREEYEQVNAALGTAHTWLKEMQRYGKAPAIDHDLVDKLIDRILVYDNRDICISLNYGDPFALLTACLNQSLGGVGRAG